MMEYDDTALQIQIRAPDELFLSTRPTKYYFHCSVVHQCTRYLDYHFDDWCGTEMKSMNIARIFFARPAPIPEFLELQAAAAAHCESAVMSSKNFLY
jgi:hypothetical protein